MTGNSCRCLCGGGGSLVRVTLVLLLFAAEAAAARAATRNAALLMLADAARAQITTASKGAAGGVCFVGPYGWTCDPSDFDSAAAAVQSITSAAAAAATASTATAQVANAPACSAQCVDGCTPPCPPLCAAAKFQAQLSLVPATTRQFFIDPWAVRAAEPAAHAVSPVDSLFTRVRLSRPQGSDGAPGTRAAPWATLHRATAHIRWLRAESPGGLASPVQLWLRSDPTLDTFSGMTFDS
jgi:hypothetical protein